MTFRQLVHAGTAGCCLFVASCSSPAEPATAELHATSIHYETLDAMIESSDAIVVGTVESVVDGRTLATPDYEDPTQIVDVALRVDEVLSGRLDTQVVRYEWMGHTVSRKTGRTGPEFVVNGIPRPRKGDSEVLFLTKEPGDVSRYGIVSLDGKLVLGPAGQLQSRSNADRAATSTLGKLLELDLSELRSRLSDST